MSGTLTDSQDPSRVNSGLFIQLTIFSEQFSHNNSNIGSGNIPEA